MDFKKSQKMAPSQRHPWELSRADIFQKIMRSMPDSLVYADVGSGDKYYAKQLLKYTNHPVYAIDKFYKHPKTSSDFIELNDIYKIPFDKVDCYIMMDFLEHIPDDKQFLHAIAKGAKSGTKCVITVPAHQFLFSEHDKNMEHYRRYSRQSLQETITSSGMRVDHIQYFYFSLFTVRLIGYLLEKIGLAKEKETLTVRWKKSAEHPVTKTARYLMNMDYLICRFMANIGISLPGLSVLAECSKP